MVTVTDDGGSSGRLRRDFDVLPPGDIRNCMAALSQDETLLARLFNYRFSGGRGLKGHSFGNLFLTAMTHLTGGDFPQAVKLSAEVLAVAGRIYPSTGANVSLEATLADGTVVSGESRIGRSKKRIAQVRLLPARVRPLGETLRAIAEADLITLGPGSLFTSIIPNLLVSGIPKAIAQSPATKVYFANLMTQPGETLDFSVADHAEAIRRHSGRYGASLIDVCVVNSGQLGSSAILRYRAKSAQPVTVDAERLQAAGIRTLSQDLVLKGGRRGQEKIRHDSSAIAAVAVELAQEHRWKGKRVKS
ncbi:MAG: hypothetical protein RL328_2655 [Acidobacteriota bacterium]